MSPNQNGISSGFQGKNGQICALLNWVPEIWVGPLGGVGVDVLGVVLEGVDALQGLLTNGALEAPLGPRHDGVEVDGCTDYCS